MSASSEHPLPVPSRRDAERRTRDVGFLRQLQAAELTPTAGSSPRWLSSLLNVTEFLVPIDDADATSVRGSVNYVDPRALSEWVREVIGDRDLAHRMDEIIASDKAYGFLAPLRKQAILDRLEQCFEVLRPIAPE